MGFIKAFGNAVGSTLADQWIEFFHCDSLTDGELLKKGEYQNRRGNNKATDNVISNGSKIVVNEGQFVLIVEDGKIVDFCGEAGHFIWDTSSEPSLFYGGFGKGLLDTFKTMGDRFKSAGDARRDQRIYYINTKEIRDAKFGTPTPIPFALTDQEIGLKLYLDLSCYGTYSYKISDPLKFYQNVTGNVKQVFKREDIEPEIKPELIDALQPAFASLAAKRIGYEEIPAHATEIKAALTDSLKAFWLEARGIELQRLNIMSLTVQNKEVLDEFREAQREYQSMKVISNPQMAAAYALRAQGDAMKAAASNENGAMNGFVGMGMMNQLGSQGVAQQAFQTIAQTPQPSASTGWTCSCGQVNQGKFCGNCGTPQPQPQSSTWQCACGQVNEGNFCGNCGSKRN